MASGSARQVLRASGTYQIRILDRGSARQLLSIYPPPPPPLAALSHSPWRDRGIRGERLRASGTPRVSYLPREDVGWRLRASGTPRVSYLPREDVGWRLRASGTPRVSYLPTENVEWRLRASATIYLSSPPFPSRRSELLSLEDRRIRGERLRASGTPRVSYLPREDVEWRLCASGIRRSQLLSLQDTRIRGERLRASGTPRVSYLPREDVGWRLRASGTLRVRFNGSACQLLSIYPPPLLPSPLSPVTKSACQPLSG